LPVLETDDFLVDETAVLALEVELAALLVVGFTGAEDTEEVVAGLLTDEVFLVGR
jgi:hypothetical protein